MEQGVSIYIHKAKAKEQLLDNGFPATILGALKGRDKSRAWSEQLRGRSSSETRYFPSMTFVCLMGISWDEGLKVFGTWEGEQHPSHVWIFSHTTTIVSIFSLVKSWFFWRWGEMSRKTWMYLGLTFLTWLLWVVSISLFHLWQRHCSSSLPHPPC